MVNGEAEAAAVKVSLAGAGTVGAKAKLLVVSGDLRDENSFEQPRKVAPIPSELSISAPRFTHTLPPNSLTVLRVVADK